MTPEDCGRLDWAKGDGLLPAIVQHARTGRVLMLGYMNEASLRETLSMKSLKATLSGAASFCFSVVNRRSMTTRITTQRARFL